MRVRANLPIGGAVAELFVLRPCAGSLKLVQIRRVFGRIAKHRTARFDRLADTGGLVRRNIVEHEDTARHTPRTSFQSLSRQLSACSHAMPTKLIVFNAPVGHDRLPRTHRPCSRIHFGICGCLIDEHQPGRVKPAGLFPTCNWVSTRHGNGSHYVSEPERCRR